MGLRSPLWQTLVSICIARLVEYRYHDGHGTCSNCPRLCCLGPLLAKRSTIFQCDNHGLVQTINKGSSRDLMVKHLLRCLWFFTAFLICRSWLYTYLEQKTTPPICCLEIKPHSFLGDILRPQGYQRYYLHLSCTLCHH